MKPVIALPLTPDFLHAARRGAKPDGFCPRCYGLLWRIDCRRRKGRGLCDQCFHWIDMRLALAEPHRYSVLKLDWDRAVWSKQLEDAELTALNAAGAIDSALEGIAARTQVEE
jgi:hypothetical protein